MIFQSLWLIKAIKTFQYLGWAFLLGLLSPPVSSFVLIPHSLLPVCLSVSPPNSPLHLVELCRILGFRPTPAEGHPQTGATLSLAPATGPSSEVLCRWAAVLPAASAGSPQRLPPPPRRVQGRHLLHHQ